MFYTVAALAAPRARGRLSTPWHAGARRHALPYAWAAQLSVRYPLRTRLNPHLSAHLSAGGARQWSPAVCRVHTHITF